MAKQIKEFKLDGVVAFWKKMYSQAHSMYASALKENEMLKELNRKLEIRNKEHELNVQQLEKINAELNENLKIALDEVQEQMKHTQRILREREQVKRTLCKVRKYAQELSVPYGGSIFNRIEDAQNTVQGKA